MLLATGGTRANHVLRNIDGVRFEQIEIDPRIAGPGDRARTIVPMILDGGGDALCLLNHGPGPKSRLLRRWGSKIEDWSSRSGVDRVRASQLVGLHIDESGRSFYFGSRNPKFVAYELTRSGELIDVTSLLGFSNVGQVNSIAVGDYDNDGDQDIYAGCGLSGILAGCQQYRGDVVFKLDLWKKQGMRFRTEGQIEIGYVLQTSDTRGNNYDPSLIRLGRSKQTIPALPYRLDVNDHRLEGKPDMLGAAVFLYRNESGDLILKASLESKQLAQQRLSGIIRCSAPVRIQETWNFGRNPREFVNKLWQNRDGKFVNVTKQAGVGDAGICQDSLFADFDNDGDLDLYVVNGGRLVGNSANVFYRNNGNGTFTDVTEQADLSGPEIGRGNAAVAIDFDQDGDLDLFSVNGHGPPLVFSREETVTKLRLFYYVSLA